MFRESLEFMVESMYIPNAISFRAIYKDSRKVDAPPKGTSIEAYFKTLKQQDPSFKSLPPMDPKTLSLPKTFQGFDDLLEQKDYNFNKDTLLWIEMRFCSNKEHKHYLEYPFGDIPRGDILLLRPQTSQRIMKTCKAKKFSGGIAYFGQPGSGKSAQMNYYLERCLRKGYIVRVKKWLGSGLTDYCIYYVNPHATDPSKRVTEDIPSEGYQISLEDPSEADIPPTLDSSDKYFVIMATSPNPVFMNQRSKHGEAIKSLPMHTPTHEQLISAMYHIKNMDRNAVNEYLSVCGPSLRRLCRFCTQDLEEILRNSLDSALKTITEINSSENSRCIQTLLGPDDAKDEKTRAINELGAILSQNQHSHTVQLFHIFKIEPFDKEDPLDGSRTEEGEESARTGRYDYKYTWISPLVQTYLVSSLLESCREKILTNKNLNDAFTAYDKRMKSYKFEAYLDAKIQALVGNPTGEPSVAVERREGG